MVSRPVLVGAVSRLRKLFAIRRSLLREEGWVFLDDHEQKSPA